MKNLANQKFNRLIALEPTSQREYGSIVWKCKCDCGKECYVSARSLLSNNTKSCGCLNNEKRAKRFLKYNEENRPNLIGQIFGYLEVLEITNQTSEKGTNLYYKCKCLNCGNITYVTGNNLQQNNIISCGCILSKGEEIIRKILNENNIIFEKQKTFENCRFPDTNRKARFDFYIPNKNYIIEYDGEQHFQSSNCWHVINIEEHDKFKNQWCKDNNIPLIRIPYTRYNKLCIEDLLLETSSFIFN